MNKQDFIREQEYKVYEIRKEIREYQHAMTRMKKNTYNYSVVELKTNKLKTELEHLELCIKFLKED